MRNPTPCSCLSSWSLKKSLWPSGVDVSPKFFQRTSQSPRMFYRYLLISCVSFSTFPAAVSDLTFQVPMVMLFLARSDFGPSVAYFFTYVLMASNGKRGPCSGRRPSRYGLSCGCRLHVVCLGQCRMVEPIPLRARPQLMSSI